MPVPPGSTPGFPPWVALSARFAPLAIPQSAGASYLPRSNPWVVKPVSLPSVGIPAGRAPQAAVASSCDPNGLSSLGLNPFGRVTFSA
jgi:hypothetical protein